MAQKKNLIIQDLKNTFKKSSKGHRTAAYIIGGIVLLVVLQNIVALALIGGLGYLAYLRLRRKGNSTAQAFGENK